MYGGCCLFLDRQQCTANSDGRRVESPSRQAQRDSVPRQLPAVDLICEPNRGLPCDCARHRTSLILERYSKARDQQDGVEYPAPLADAVSALVEFDDRWERERTANALTGVAVLLHATGCSLRETQVIFRSLGVERSHKQFGTGYIGWLTAFQTRRRHSRRGSRLTKPLSGLTATNLGCTLQ